MKKAQMNRLTRRLERMESQLTMMAMQQQNTSMAPSTCFSSSNVSESAGMNQSRAGTADPHYEAERAENMNRKGSLFVREGAGWRGSLPYLNYNEEEGRLGRSIEDAYREENEEEEEGGEEDFKEALKTYVEDKNMDAATNFLDDSKPLSRRIIWFLLLALLSVFMIYSIYCVAEYLDSKPTKGYLEVKSFESADFPVVTVCNNNPIKKNLLRAFAAPGDINVSDESANATYALGLMYWNLHREEIEQLSYTYEEFILHCTYQGKECARDQWKRYVDARYGNCYQFNLIESNSSKSPLRVSSFDRLFDDSLKLWLNIQRQSYLSTVDAYGAVILVHDQHTPPDMSRGQWLPVGFESHIGISKREVHRLRGDWGSCDSAKDLQVYSTHACMGSCLQKVLQDQCGCRGIGDLSSTSLPVCTNFQYISQTGAIKTIINSNNCTMEDLQRLGTDVSGCNCPEKCFETTYRQEISLSNYPTTQATPGIFERLLERYGGDYFSKTYTNLTNASPKKDKWVFLNQNGIKASLYYSSLTVEMQKEIEAYSLTEFAGEVGGLMGLFLGMSLLTIAEFIDFIYVTIRKKISSYKNNTDTDNNNSNNSNKNTSEDYIAHQKQHKDEEQQQIERQPEEEEEDKSLIKNALLG
eukprot:Nk52_evm19s2531 gene=Nk52_evmTU19s2531